MNYSPSSAGLRRFLGGCFLAGLAVSPLRADVLEMINGDHYSGTLVGLTASTFEFRSEIQGLVKIPRDKVARINFQESAPSKLGSNAMPSRASGLVKADGPVTNSPVAGKAVATRLATPASTAVGKPGIDPKVVSQVQEQILGQAGPEATSKFNSMVASLMTGSLTVDGVRAQARSAIRDIQDAKSELGPEAGGMLDMYLKILQDFVAEADQPGANQTGLPAKKN